VARQLAERSDRLFKLCHTSRSPEEFPAAVFERATGSTNNADLGLRKDIRINETMKVQLRMEFVNAFNHPLLASLSGGAPVVSPSSSTFGQITVSNQQNYARRAQMAVKFIF